MSRVTSCAVPAIAEPIPCNVDERQWWIVESDGTIKPAKPLKKAPKPKPAAP